MIHREPLRQPARIELGFVSTVILVLIGSNQYVATYTMPRRVSSTLELGRKIAEARKRAGLSVRHVAETAGISAQQMRRIESGRTEASAITIARIARVLNLSCDALLGDVRTIAETVERLWQENSLSESLPGSVDADLSARKAILVSMGLWRE